MSVDEGEAASRAAGVLSRRVPAVWALIVWLGTFAAVAFDVGVHVRGLATAEELDAARAREVSDVAAVRAEAAADRVAAARVEGQLRAISAQLAQLGADVREALDLRAKR